MKLSVAIGIEKYEATMTASAPTMDQSKPGVQVKQ
jgi:hypothetical protein